MSMFPAYGTPSKEHVKHFHQWEVEQAKKQLEGMCAKEFKSCPNIEVSWCRATPPPKS